MYTRSISRATKGKVCFLELKSLRKATERQHRKVEKDLALLRPTLTLTLTLSDYVALLKRFYGFHRVWEPQVATQLAAELPDLFPPRRKLQNLEADLRYFGCAADDLLGLASCVNLPPLESVGSALGSLYVIEGSTLGGRILTRHFAGHLGVRPEAGCRFFSGYGERTGSMWSEFGELMETRWPSEDEDMLQAAVATFESLGGWTLNADA